MPAPRPSPPVADRYEPRERIGRGGMGEVFLAWDRVLERDVALKRLRADMADDPTMRRRVQAEARAAAQLSHPNAVSVFDSGEQDGHPFIVMELLDGRTLADELETGAMEPDDVRAMAIQVLDALQAAHYRGLIHRDVKPSNILCGPDDNWKVADFGIAKYAEGATTLTATTDVLGSPGYLAPERLGGATATERSDLFAVGVVMYEALTGRKPFDGDHPLAVAVLVREGTFEPIARVRPDIASSLAAVVERAMASDPASRFASAREMADAIRDPHEIDTDLTVPIDLGAATQPMPADPIGPAPSSQEATAPMRAPDPAREETPTQETSTEEAPADEAPAEDPERRTHGRSLGLVLAGIVLALTLVTAGIIALSSGTDPAPADRSPNADQPADGVRVPAPLQDSLDRLQEAIAP